MRAGLTKGIKKEIKEGECERGEAPCGSTIERGEVMGARGGKKERWMRRAGTRDSWT
jgi:hypothetical protein